MKKGLIVASVLVTFLLSGCMYALSAAAGGAAVGGSVFISDATLQKKAASALGVSESKVKISNRSNDGIKINFTATVGKKASQCYVTSSMGVTSDAICTNGGKAACDELSKRAGRC